MIREDRSALFAAQRQAVIDQNNANISEILVKAEPEDIALISIDDELHAIASDLLE